MEKLNIKLLLNSIAEDELGLENSPINQPNQTSQTPSNNYTYLLEGEGYSELLAQFEGEDAASLAAKGFILAIGAAVAAYGAKFLKCLKKIKEMLGRDGTWGAQFRQVRTEIARVERGSLAEAALWLSLAKMVGQLASELKNQGCFNRFLKDKIEDLLSRIFPHSSQKGARKAIRDALDGAKSWVDAFGESLAAARPDIVRNYASAVATANAQLGQQCVGGGGMSAAETAALVAAAVALVAAVVLTGGAAGVIAAKLLAVGGGLFVCGTAMSAESLAEAGEEAARLEREYFGAANAPNAEEEYIDNVLDPSGLSDVSNYPGNPGG